MGLFFFSTSKAIIIIVADGGDEYQFALLAILSSDCPQTKIGYTQEK
jgi:hypothetical protein